MRPARLRLIRFTVLFALAIAACSGGGRELPSTSAMETQFAEQRGPTFTPATTPTVRPVLTTAANVVPSPLDVIVVVDGGAGNHGRFISLVLDAAGHAVISYYDAQNQDLKLAYCRDVNCSRATISTVTSSGRVGQHTSLALDATGNPVISFFEEATNAKTLVLAHCNDPHCISATLNTVDSQGEVGEHTSLALDAGGNPVISYYDISNRALKLAHCSDPNCASAAITTVDSKEHVGQYTSLALDATGNPLITYVDWLPIFSLNLAYCHDPNCESVTITEVDGSYGVGRYSSLLLDAAGNPAISYYDDANDDLRLARCGDPLCQTVTITIVDSEGEAGWFTSLALDEKNNPVISYYDRTNLSLKLAICHDPNCAAADIAIVDNDEDVGWHSSLALDCAGNPIIAYYDFANQSLKVASVSGARGC